jgi:hypothetical protein
MTVSAAAQNAAAPSDDDTRTQYPTFMRDSYFTIRGGWIGYLSLEPHLAAHEQFGGFSGEQLFNLAVQALRKLCNEIDLPLIPPPEDD